MRLQGGSDTWTSGVSADFRQGERCRNEGGGAGGYTIRRRSEAKPVVCERVRVNHKQAMLNHSERVTNTSMY
jgi:hypothetical protein